MIPDQKFFRQDIFVFFRNAELAGGCGERVGEAGLRLLQKGSFALFVKKCEK